MYSDVFMDAFTDVFRCTQMYLWMYSRMYSDVFTDVFIEVVGCIQIYLDIHYAYISIFFFLQMYLFLTLDKGICQMP